MSGYYAHADQQDVIGIVSGAANTANEPLQMNCEGDIELKMTSSVIAFGGLKARFESV